MAEIKTVRFPKAIFNVKVNKTLLAQAVHVFLANQRQGTASTKTRGEVSGSTKKIYKQKGTGRARHGARKAPIFVGGGIVGGPKPRDYSLKLNKLQKKQALFSALTLKHQEKRISIVNNKYLTMKPKTKELVLMFEEKGIKGKSALIVFGKMERNNLLLAGRNIPEINFIDACSLNPYTVMKYEYILFTEDALPVLSKHFLRV